MKDDEKVSNTFARIPYFFLYFFASAVFHTLNTPPHYVWDEARWGKKSSEKNLSNMQAAWTSHDWTARHTPLPNKTRRQSHNFPGFEWNFEKLCAGLPQFFHHAAGVEVFWSIGRWAGSRKWKFLECFSSLLCDVVNNAMRMMVIGGCCGNLCSLMWTWWWMNGKISKTKMRLSRYVHSFF